MITKIGVITGHDEDSILKPRLLTGLFKELTNSHIRITDAFVHDNSFFRIHLLILFWDDIRCMTANSKACCHERLLHFSYLRAPILQERFIPNAPVTIEVVIFALAKTWISIIILTPVILLESSFIGKCQESHRPTIGTMEESCAIPFFGQ